MEAVQALRRAVEVTALRKQIGKRVKTRTLRMTYALTAEEKRGWGDGPWIYEPELVEWVDNATAMPCLIMRNIDTTGALCGYVGVPPSHLMYGVEYNSGIMSSFIAALGGEEPQAGLSPHGGISYCGPRALDFGLDRFTDYWYFGFDCGHGGDRMPKIEATLRSLKIRYPDMPTMRSVPNLVLEDLTDNILDQVWTGEETAKETDILDRLLRPRYCTVHYVIQNCEMLAAQLNLGKL